MPAVCSSLYLERKHRLEYIEGGASRKVDRQIGGGSYLGMERWRTETASSDSLAMQRPGRRKKEKQKQKDGRTDTG